MAKSQSGDQGEERPQRQERNRPSAVTETVGPNQEKISETWVVTAEELNKRYKANPRSILKMIQGVLMHRDVLIEEVERLEQETENQNQG